MLIHFRFRVIPADYNVAGGLVSASQVLRNWEDIISNATTLDHGFIVLEHDLFAQTVDLATGYILPAALANNPKFDIKPVISCLNKPLSDSYLETNDNATNPLPTASGAYKFRFSPSLVHLFGLFDIIKNTDINVA